MIVQAFPSGPLETNAYLVICSHTKSAVIIDPAPESAPTLMAYIEKKELHPKAIWLTHSHWDHIADTAILKKHYQIPVYVHPEDKGNLESPGSDGLPCWLTIEAVKPTHFIQDQDILSVGNLEFQVIYTPGHTPGGVCFYNSEAKILISGDTLFKGSMGNLSFTTGRPALMGSSLARLAELPKETVVYPGHGPTTTIGQERWLKEVSI